MPSPFPGNGELERHVRQILPQHEAEALEPPLLDRKVDVPTLLLYGMDDQVIGPDFLPTCEVAFTKRTGPVVLPGAGHFLQWERADLFNPLVTAFFGDLRVRQTR